MWVAEALAGGNALPAIGLDETVVVAGQVRDRLLDNVMLYREVVGDTLALGVSEGRFDNVFGVLDLCRQRVQVVLSIEIKVDAVVAKGFHVRLAARRGVALGVGRAHIGWVFADDVGKGALVLAHLGFAHIRRDVLEGIVGPGVRGDLVALGNHTLNDRGVGSGGVDRTLSKVVAGDEKGCVEAELLEYVEKLAGIKVWAIVIC